MKPVFTKPAPTVITSVMPGILSVGGKSKVKRKQKESRSVVSLR